MGEQTEIPETFRIPDAMWEQTKPLLPPEKPKPKGGRPRNDDRQITGFYFLGATIHRPFSAGGERRASQACACARSAGVLTLNSERCVASKRSTSASST
jgi:transposase